MDSLFTIPSEASFVYGGKIGHKIDHNKIERNINIMKGNCTICTGTSYY